VKRVWIIAAGAFAIAALVFLLRSDYDKAFVVGALGAITWFLSYRVQIKEVMEPDEQSEELDEDSESDEKD